MCGLVGIVGHSESKQSSRVNAAFKSMLMMDVVRGKDSTGVFVKPPTSEGFYGKSLGVPDNLLKNKDVVGTIAGLNNSQSDYVIRMGHNRSATIGAINADNAHPYDFTNLIGAHNGTLRTGYHSFRGYDHTKTDSFALYSEMNRRLEGVVAIADRREVMKEVVDAVNGAMALSFYDKITNRFYLFRNSQRPLHQLHFNESGLMLYASEPWMIYAALIQHRLLNVDDFDRTKHITELPTDTFYEYDPNVEGSAMRTCTFRLTTYQEAGYYAGFGGTYHQRGGKPGFQTAQQKAEEDRKKAATKNTNVVVLAKKKFPLFVVQYDSTNNNGTTHIFTDVDDERNRVLIYSSQQARATPALKEVAEGIDPDKNPYLYCLEANRYTSNIVRNDIGGVDMWAVPEKVEKFLVEDLKPFYDKRSNEEFSASIGNAPVEKKETASCCFCSDPTDKDEYHKVKNSSLYLCDTCLKDGITNIYGFN